MTLDPAVMALAEAQAARDRETLARLIAAGTVMPVGPDRDRVWLTGSRRKDRINLALRPKKGKRRR